MTDEKAKKRSWGKSKNRGKGSFTMDLTDSMIESDMEPTKRIKLSGESSQQHSVIDLQHPELMSDESLVAVLTNIKVPIPVYPDGSPSRERLIYLFKKHVTPRPQRTNFAGRRFWRKSSHTHRSSHHFTSKTEEMEVDSCADQDWLNISKSDTVNTPLQKKRNLEDSDTLSSPAKKPSLEITCDTLSKISVNDNQSGPGHKTATPSSPLPESTSAVGTKTQRKLIRLKRPVKAVVSDNENMV